MTPNPSTTAQPFPKGATRTSLGTFSIVGIPSHDAITGEICRHAAGVAVLEGGPVLARSPLAGAREESLPVNAGGFPAIYADPPWRFKVRSAKGLGRSADRHYRTMTIADVRALPVSNIAARDAWLFLWVPGPFLALGLQADIMRAWGFEPSSMGFVWIKLKRAVKGHDWRFADNIEDNLHIGLGYTTRKNAEFCLIGRRGSPRRLSGAVREVIVAPRSAHSAKPPETRDRIQAFCPGPYVELFARGPAPEGWTVWGDESTPVPSQ